MSYWNPRMMPDQTGRVAVITGASSGIGAEAAEALAGKGAQLVLAVRDPARGDATRRGIIARHPAADVIISLVDLADLASIRDCAARLAGSLPRIDILLNNAGLGLQPVRATTVDGFERQFGTNHLGHFAFTGLLIPTLLRAPAPRVVTIASIAHRRGRINFANLQSERPYNAGAAYSQSKLANLLFAFELDRRARAAGSRLMSLAAHPGISATGFIKATGMPGYKVALGDLAFRWFGQAASEGAKPGLYAAAMPDVDGGQYWGPDGILELRGSPALAKAEPQALDRALAQRLWSTSEDLTGVEYPDLLCGSMLHQGIP